MRLYVELKSRNETGYDEESVMRCEMAVIRMKRGPMRWPLRNQILVPFVLLLLGVICTVSALNAWLATQRTKNQIEEQLQGIAATLADSSFPLTDMVLRQMHGLSGAEFVLTADGRALATSGLTLPADGTSLAVEDSQQLRLGPPVTVGEQRFFEMVLAIRGAGYNRPGDCTFCIQKNSGWKRGVKRCCRRWLSAWRRYWRRRCLRSGLPHG